MELNVIVSGKIDMKQQDIFHQLFSLMLEGKTEAALENYVCRYFHQAEKSLEALLDAYDNAGYKIVLETYADAK